MAGAPSDGTAGGGAGSDDAGSFASGGSSAAGGTGVGSGGADSASGGNAGTGGGSAGTGGGSASTGGAGNACSLPPEVRPYDPSFALYKLIPDNPRLDPRSAAVAAQLDENTAIRKVSLATAFEVPAVYRVTASDPLYTVTSPQPLNGVKFRIPTSSLPGSGADYPVEILDPSHPTLGSYVELRLWQATIDHTNKTIGGNGGGLFYYNNDGAIQNPDGTRSSSYPFQGWGTGSGLSYLAGLLRPEEVGAGEICHALRFAYSKCHFTKTYRYPATRTDQPMCADAELGPVEGRMEMGMRLQLDPAVDCDARTVPAKNSTHDVSEETRLLRMFCKALQRYGMIVLDGTTTNGLLFYAEDERTANWQSVLGTPYDFGNYSFAIRDKDTPSDGLTRTDTSGIPWHRLRVLAADAFD